MVKMNHPKPKNYVLLGPPGSGKSTQAKLLKIKHDLAHIEIGSELRRLAESDTELGRTVHEIINIRKELVPDGLIDDVLGQVLKTIPHLIGVLLDGAPRKLSQIKEVEHAFSLHDRVIDRIIFLDISEQVAIERISTRWLCQECKAPYIGSREIIENLGPCSVCGGALSQRTDDTPEGVAKRYQVFTDETRPVIEHYEKKNKLIRINAELDPEEIASLIEQSL